jgi:thioredoxin 1
MQECAAHAVRKLPTAESSHTVENGFMETPYAPETLSRAQVDRLAGTTVLDFGTNWCGFCRAAGPAIAAGLQGVDLQHVKVEDGPGRPLGRSFRVKLWPTLVVLRDGVEVARVVRPQGPAQVSQALAAAPRSTPGMD